VTFRPYVDAFRTALQYIAQAAKAFDVGPYEAFLYASTAATAVLKKSSYPPIDAPHDVEALNRLGVSLDVPARFLVDRVDGPRPHQARTTMEPRLANLGNPCL
jgi:hypothetical protein